ncbi:MAG: hypothetical protein BGO12_11340 [Verrucomicrobia bacterium 61-8]|nr:hypothetical protein [Verrucomicrobiota bacterium]OJV25760.1 MAG: hypothetical protein BGO12_11340 [Verrucomicrobia bacterium 61-8]
MSGTKKTLFTGIAVAASLIVACALGWILTHSLPHTEPVTSRQALVEANGQVLARFDSTAGIKPGMTATIRSDETKTAAKVEAVNGAWVVLGFTGKSLPKGASCRVTIDPSAEDEQ